VVEVWLCFGEAEYPALLPDPIDLRIFPRVSPSKEEKINVLNKLRDALNSVDNPVVWIDDTLSENERRVVRDLLKKTGVKFKEEENYNVLIGITRQSPITLWRGVVPYVFIKTNFDKVKELITEKKRPRLTENELMKDYPKELMSISLVMADNEFPWEVYWGEGTDPWIKSLNYYKERWELKISLSPITIASIGGYPYDAGLANTLESTLKLLSHKGISTLIILSDSSLEFEYDPTKLSAIKEEDIASYQDLVLYSFIKSIKEFSGTVYFVSSLPKTFTKILNVKSAKKVEDILNRIPAKKKRIISVIEDLTNTYIPK